MHQLTLPSPPRRGSQGQIAASAWLDLMLAHGLHSFTRDAAHRTLGGAAPSVDVALSRLVAKGRLIRPVKGLYVIVSPEHQLIGAPPPLWYIDAVMRHLDAPYYVGLLSAAALLGAAPQAPQELQVLTTRWRPTRVLGRGRIRWIANQHQSTSAVQTITTPTGTVPVSTAETTAVDLVRYRHHAGYFGHVVTVLAELGEQLQADRLVTAVRDDLPTAQRLGVLLTAAGHGALADAFGEALPLANARTVPLDPAQPTDGAPSDPRWRVLLNTVVDPD